MSRLNVRKRWRPASGAGIALVAAGIMLFAAPVAHAALGFQGLSAKPSNLAAGANSNVSVHIGFSDPGDQVKDLTVHLPPGLVGNPTATPLCTVSQLNSDNCPASSRVGNVTAKVNVIVGGAVPTPLTVNGSLYNLVPQAGEPARFGIVLRPVKGLLPKIIQQSAVKLRPDFGLDTVINDFPREASGNEADIKSIDIQLFGKANGKGFMRNPTSCVPKTVTFDAVSYSGHAAHGSAPAFTPTSCGALPFSPRLSVEVGEKGATDAQSVTPLTTVIDQSDGEAGLENAEVLLPSSIGPTTVGNQCSLAQFQSNAAACPALSIVGKATATSSYLPAPESGPVVVVEPGPTDALPRLGVDLHGPLVLQLLGNFVVEREGLGNAFRGLPDIPIAHFELRFNGGPGGLIATSNDLCNSSAPVFHAAFNGYNGASKTQNPAARIVGCSGGGGGGKPHASVKVKRARSKHPRMRFAIHSGSAPLQGAKLRLPKGLRLAKGKAWRQGAKASNDTGRVPRSKLHHSRRSLTIDAAAGGSNSLTVSLRRHTVLRTKTLAHKRLRFGVVARDVDGRRTSQHLRVRVR